jgi:uncharacterized protein (TIGR04255 family)
MIAVTASESLPSNPIALVIAQLKFPLKSEVLERSRLSPFADIVNVDYPIYTEDHVVNMIVTDRGISPQQGEHLHRFTSPDKAWSAILGSEQLVLECRKGSYDGIDDFVGRFGTLVGALTALGVKQQVRLGFRFVNEIRTSAGTAYSYWRSKLNKEALGFDAAEKFGGDVQSTIAEVTVLRPDGTFRLRRGFLPSGSTVAASAIAGPQSISPFYLIDMDYFNEQVIDIKGDVAERLRAYNIFMHSTFRWLIGEGELLDSFRKAKT